MRHDEWSTGDGSACLFGCMIYQSLSYCWIPLPLCVGWVPVHIFSMCVCSCVVHGLALVHIWRPEGDIRRCPPLLFTISLRVGSVLWTQSSLMWLGQSSYPLWSVNLQSLLCLVGMTCHTWLFYGSGDLHSCPQTCTASAVRAASSRVTELEFLTFSEWRIRFR